MIHLENFNYFKYNFKYPLDNVVQMMFHENFNFFLLKIFMFLDRCCNVMMQK